MFSRLSWPVLKESGDFCGKELNHLIINAKGCCAPEPIIVSQQRHDTLDLTMEVMMGHGELKEHELVVSPGCETSN